MPLDHDERARGSSSALLLSLPAVVDDGGARRAAGASSCATANCLGQPQEKAQQLRTCRAHRSSSCSGEGTHRR
jgi:hypothetical protein